jgi:hypothetical protein
MTGYYGDVDEAYLRQVGAITSEEAQRWVAGLTQADSEGSFYASLTGTIVVGQKAG